MFIINMTFIYYSEYSKNCCPWMNYNLLQKIFGH
jgi:hypothetical protein